MKGFKNFIYKTNDILLAIIIIALACGLIMWRMDAIMNYPKTLSEQETTTQTEEQAKEKSAKAESQTTAQSKDAAKEGAKGDAAESKDADKQDSQTQKDTSSSTGVFSDGKLTSSVKVNVAGASATEAAGCLVDKGLFSSYDDYANYCKKAGTNPEQIKAGTFTFSPGMSKTAIAKMVTQ